MHSADRRGSLASNRLHEVRDGPFEAVRRPPIRLLYSRRDQPDDKSGSLDCGESGATNGSRQSEGVSRKTSGSRLGRFIHDGPSVGDGRLSRRTGCTACKRACVPSSGGGGGGARGGPRRVYEQKCVGIRPCPPASCKSYRRIYHRSHHVVDARRSCRPCPLAPLDPLIGAFLPAIGRVVLAPTAFICASGRLPPHFLLSVFQLFFGRRTTRLFVRTGRRSVYVCTSSFPLSDVLSVRTRAVGVEGEQLPAALQRPIGQPWTTSSRRSHAPLPYPNSRPHPPLLRYLGLQCCLLLVVCRDSPSYCSSVFPTCVSRFSKISPFSRE